ncbi:MAG TPA: hypothetical protein VGE77_04435 [Nocardioides sp.]
MGWNTTVAVLEHTTIADLGRAGLTPAGDPVTADEATSLLYDGVAAQQQGAHVVLLGGGPDLMVEAPGWAAALGRTLVLAVWGSTGSTWVWSVAGPDVQRQVVVADYAVADTTGEPQPEESQVTTRLEDDPEDWLFELLEARTGVRLDLEAPAQPLAW